MPDLTLAEYRGQEPGSFGWPCYTNDDCVEGLCVESFQSFVCTQTCTEECPMDWVCGTPVGDGPDGAFCMPPHGTLCRPCEVAEDCVASDAEDSECVDYDGKGYFCASSCELGDECPADFVCRTVDLSDDSTRSLCVRDMRIPALAPRSTPLKC